MKPRLSKQLQRTVTGIKVGMSPPLIVVVTLALVGGQPGGRGLAGEPCVAWGHGDVLPGQPGNSGWDALLCLVLGLCCWVWGCSPGCNSPWARCVSSVSVLVPPQLAAHLEVALRQERDGEGSRSMNPLQLVCQGRVYLSCSEQRQVVIPGGFAVLLLSPLCTRGCFWTPLCYPSQGNQMTST